MTKGLSPPACGEPQVITVPSTSRAAKALWLPTTAATAVAVEATEGGKTPPVRLSPQGCREPKEKGKMNEWNVKSCIDYRCIIDMT